MDCTERQMTAGQILALLDAAMRSPRPFSFLDAVATTFRTIGRHQDATAAAWLRYLYAGGEIELLMGLRAAWARGDEVAARNPRAGTGAISEWGARGE